MRDRIFGEVKQQNNTSPHNVYFQQTIHKSVYIVTRRQLYDRFRAVFLLLYILDN